MEPTPPLPPMYVTLGPSEYAQAPEWMNVHFLLETERCPRAVTLKYSSYPAIWPKNRYPERPSLSALSGQIVHATVGRLVKELASRSCKSLQESRAVECLRALGGYSAVISVVTKDILSQLDANPRFEPLRDRACAQLQLLLPQLREQVQLLLSRLSWESTTLVRREFSGKIDAKAVGVRRPLTPGAHFEVEMRDEETKWRGIADLIEFNENACSITDFKTGDYQEAHELQIRIYALLWRRDSGLNPSAHSAKRLVLSYPKGELTVSPLDEVTEVEFLKELLERTAAVRRSLGRPDAKAKLSIENCRYCTVRHLCSDYWTGARSTYGWSQVQGGRCFDDMEVILTEQRSLNLWEAKCQASNFLSPGSSTVVRFPTPIPCADALVPGCRIRLIDAMLCLPELDNPAMVHLVGTTELFFPSSELMV